jgi:hypothetical protein
LEWWSEWWGYLPSFESIPLLNRSHGRRQGVVLINIDLVNLLFDGVPFIIADSASFWGVRILLKIKCRLSNK